MGMTGTISIRNFALLRDLAGKGAESLAIEHGATASQVYMRVAEKYGFPLGLTDIRMAVNDDFASTDHPLVDGDALAFIPPVSGG
jgi:molybdopterin converting factor subunit 1